MSECRLNVSIREFWTQNVSKQSSNFFEIFKHSFFYFRCIAGSRNRFIASLPAKLRIARLGDFDPPAERPETIEAYVGNNVVIGCKVPDSIPPAYIQVLNYQQHILYIKVFGINLQEEGEMCLRIDGNECDWQETRQK